MWVVGGAKRDAANGGLPNLVVCVSARAEGGRWALKRSPQTVQLSGPICTNTPAFLPTETNSAAVLCKRRGGGGAEGGAAVGLGARRGYGHGSRRDTCSEFMSQDAKGT